MASHEELRAVRLQKKDILLSKGIAVYPSDSKRTHEIQTLINEFETLSSKGEKVIIDGRIMSKRGQGAILFVDVFDGSAKIQVVFKKDNPISYIDNSSVEECFDLFKETADTGDFVEISGVLFVTQSGQQSIEVDGWRMLSKSLLPIPDGWYGLKDEDERYRKRYLDMILTPEIHETARRRSLFWNTIRNFLIERDYIEVETPVLETTTGGADARPFITHHNALDIDVYLRISAGELWQKRLLIGGFPKVFEIGRIFRNEGMSPEHAQDYTQLEFYEAYSDFNKGMEMVKNLYISIAQKVYGRTDFENKGMKFDLSDEWQIYHFGNIIKDKFGIDVHTVSVDEIGSILNKNNIKHDPNTLSVERGVDLLWKTIRKDLAGPGFLIGVPVYLETLAKKSKEDTRVVERFQIILAGSEVGKGFSELNDPVDQAERFTKQQELRDAGDEEAQMSDPEYVEAMEYGMPPAFGFGLSERFFSFLEGKTVREAQLFPLMRPKSE
ncbi:MAG: lysyl-tRNA synthetase [Candidatus Parcubacteria bacterium]|jgi:lysyl-tRNA synthetase class 2